MCFTHEMKNRRIIGKLVILVPYKPVHVEKYHKWMMDSEIQYLTASEPLTLNEEYEMQKKWVMDANKCTFIILDRQSYEATGSEVDSMIGDTNVFLLDNELRVGEVEIMIAETSHRRQGKGKEALLLMMRFAMDVLLLHEILAKIKYENSASRSMFEDIGFQLSSRSDVFKEFTYTFDVNNESNVSALNFNTNHLKYELI